MREIVPLLACVALVANCGGNKSPEISDPTPEPVSDARNLAQCFEAWNTTENNHAMIAKNFTVGGTPYVNVDFAADFPDRCSVTLVSVERNTVSQFIEAPDNPNGWSMTGGGTPADLPESVKNWNATVDPETGFLAAS